MAALERVDDRLEHVVYPQNRDRAVADQEVAAVGGLTVNVPRNRQDRPPVFEGLARRDQSARLDSRLNNKDWRDSGGCFAS